MRYLARVLTVLVFFAALSALESTIAEASGFKVYGYRTSAEGQAEVAYWYTRILQSGVPYNFFGQAVNKEGLSQHSIELEYGVTDRWMISGYLDFEQHPDGNLEYAQFRTVFSRYRLFEQGERFFDTAIYLEYYIPHASSQRDEKIETRLILEKTLVPFVIRLNPILEKTLSGADVEEGVELEYAAGVYAPIDRVRVGLEAYGKFGEMRDWKPWDAQEHYLFPDVEFHLGPHVEVDLGVGVGLTKASDDLVVKTILEYEF